MSQMSKDVTKCLKMSQDISKCHKTSQNVFKCLEMSQMSQNVANVSKCLKMSRNILGTVSKYLKTKNRNLRQSFLSLFSRQRCPRLSGGRNVVVLVVRSRFLFRDSLFRSFFIFDNFIFHFF